VLAVVPTPVTVRAPAKVNLHLAVGDLRADGYHDLTTLFQSLSLTDEVTVALADEAGLEVRGEGADAVPTDSSNLVWKAVRALAAHVGRDPDEPKLRILINKGIPVAGGMAGGSADGAAALLGCDALWGTGTDRAVLLDLAAELGSDVPFSLVGGVALGEGRGERLTPVPTAGTFHWVFAVAEGGLSTPAVYGECDRLRDLGTGSSDAEVPVPATDPALLEALRTGDPVGLGAALRNDLQAAALSLRPSLADTLRAGTDAGAIGALVSGSGPTCAFVAKDAAAAAVLAAALTASGTCRTARTAEGPVPGAVLV
jgi:4-diphosphocytidyl-2-C-methyl-D-erythritol kinase